MSNFPLAAIFVLPPHINQRTDGTLLFDTGVSGLCMPNGPNFFDGAACRVAAYAAPPKNLSDSEATFWNMQPKIGAGDGYGRNS